MRFPAGALAAAAPAQLSGAAKVIIVGGPAERLRRAAQAGIGDVHIDIAGAADPRKVLAEVAEATGGLGADLVIECAGVPAAVAQGLSLARRGGSYLVIGRYTDAGDTVLSRIRSSTGNWMWSARGRSPERT